MPILKFWTDSNKITLENLRLEDITSDRRTSLLNKTSFLQDKYRIDKNVFMALNDIFFKLSKIFNRQNTPINAMLLKEGVNNIIIVPSNSYVFWNGKSIDPIEYNIGQFDLTKLL